MDRSHLHGITGWLLTFAVVAATIWWLAGLFWRITGPDPVSAPRQPIQEPAALARRINQAHLFGQATTATTNPAIDLQGIRVTGILASSRQGNGQALLGRDKEKPRWVKEGVEFEKGIGVVRVGPRQVELQAGSSTQILRLPEKATR